MGWKWYGKYEKNWYVKFKIKERKKLKKKGVIVDYFDSCNIDI